MAKNRNRAVRNVSDKNTSYTLLGFMLTERMKERIYRKGLKTKDQTWTEFFKNADVVYRYNPVKGKLDVFVGDIHASEYARGGRTFKPNYNWSNDAALLVQEGIVEQVKTRTIRVSNDKVY